jgi:hypothetical protein
MDAHRNETQEEFMANLIADGILDDGGDDPLERGKRKNFLARTTGKSIDTPLRRALL